MVQNNMFNGIHRKRFPNIQYYQAVAAFGSLDGSGKNSLKFSLSDFFDTIELNYKRWIDILDDEELKQIILKQSETISMLVEEIKYLSYRVDNLEASTDETLENHLDGGRIIRNWICHWKGEWILIGILCSSCFFVSCVGKTKWAFKGIL